MSSPDGLCRFMPNDGAEALHSLLAWQSFFFVLASTECLVCASTFAAVRSRCPWALEE